VIGRKYNNNNNDNITLIIIMILKHEDFTYNSAHKEWKGNIDSGNSRGNWNNVQITQTVTEQHTGKA
jgi:hypothetical protein